MLAVLSMCFGTIFTMDAPTSSKAEGIFDKVINAVGDGESVDMPDSVDISIPFLVKSVGSAGKVIKSAIETAKSANDAKDAAEEAQSDIQDDPTSADEELSDLEDDLNELQENAAELSKNLRDKDFVGFVTIISAIFAAFTENFILALIYIGLMFISIAFPISVAFRLIISVISVIIHINDPSAATKTVSKSYRAVISTFPLLLLIKILVPDVTYSFGVTLMAILLAIGIVLGVVISRLRKYTPAQLRYINLIQTLSATAIVGYVLFIVGFSKLGLFNAIWEKMPTYLKSAGAMNILLFFVLIFLMIALLMLAFKHIKNISCRLACMLPTPKVKKNKPIKKFAKDTFIFTSAASLALVTIPFVLPIAGFELDITANVAAFVTFAAGLDVMFASEILMAVLKKPICHGLTAEDVKSVLSGYTETANTSSDSDFANANDDIEAPAAETPVVPEETEVPIEAQNETADDTNPTPEVEVPPKVEPEPAVTIEITPDDQETKVN